MPPAKGARRHKLYHVVLGQSNVDANKNKFYRLEIWTHKKKAYLYTLWGRIGTKGQSKTVHLTLPAAIKAFKRTFRTKTGHPWADDDSIYSIGGKGKYVPIQVSVKSTKQTPVKATAEHLHEDTRAVVKRIFQECKGWTKKQLHVSFETAEIATPLGPLDGAQLRKGGEVLRLLGQLVPASDFVYEAGLSASGQTVHHYKKAPPPSAAALQQISELTSRYFSIIPHKLGAKKPPLLKTNIALGRELSLLQQLQDMNRLLLRDSQALRTKDVHRQYASLGCTIAPVDPGSAEFRKMGKQVQPLQLRRLFRVRRPEESDAFHKDKNIRVLFHGSRMHNWLGLLSKGLLLPAQVEATGVALTDSGWLGRGLYFGDHETAALYASKGAGKTAYILACQVAMGRIKRTRELDQSLTAAPPGYDSCHGVKLNKDKPSQFAQDEFVIYENNRQRMTHLLEIEGGKAGFYAANV